VWHNIAVFGTERLGRLGSSGLGWVHLCVVRFGLAGKALLGRESRVSQGTSWQASHVLSDIGVAY
jgi:hypothetical protein